MRPLMPTCRLQPRSRMWSRSRLTRRRTRSRIPSCRLVSGSRLSCRRMRPVANGHRGERPGHRAAQDRSAASPDLPEQASQQDVTGAVGGRVRRGCRLGEPLGEIGVGGAIEHGAGQQKVLARADDREARQVLTSDVSVIRDVPRSGPPRVAGPPNGSIILGVTSKSWPNAAGLISEMEARHKRVLAEGVRQRELRARAEAARRAAEARRRKAQYYTVRRGDALGSLATQWNTTPDKLRTWNRLSGNTIKIGQTLMVKPAT